jgi:hypothetical protein
MTTHYLLSCQISADVRQSVQIKFDDLKLPKQVIDTLEQNNTVSIRPNLSNALKKELDSLRVLQRELYDSYCIHYGDNHFVTHNYFHDANDLIKTIRTNAKDANDRLKDIWQGEFDRWQQTTEGILGPLFKDETEYKLAFEAYMRFFPTREEYKTPIRVNVLGPLPISLQRVNEPIEGDFDSLINYENSINTQQVLEAAKGNAADKALLLSAELIDDLDTRTVSKIGRQQTGSDKKRGSWQITAEKLKLISDSVVGFDQLANLSSRLLQAGNDLQLPDKTKRQIATEEFFEVQEEIRRELETICNSRDSSKGLEKLKKSIALSSSYATLCERIKSAENINSLNLLAKDVNLEVDIYEQRSKKLRKLVDQRKELIEATGGKLDDLITSVKTSKDDDDLDVVEVDF